MTDEIQETTDITSSTSHYVNSEKAATRGYMVRSQRGDSASEIDPRKLLRDPNISELRWYAERSIGKVLVNKPVEDAYKNGYELTGNDATWAEKKREELNYDYYHKLAEKKARRDGFALLYLGTRDPKSSVAEGLSPDENLPAAEWRASAKVTHIKVWTIDNLVQCGRTDVFDQVKAGYPDITRQDDFIVRKSGIVIDTRPRSPAYGDPLGYVLDTGHARDGTPKYQFVHKDRVIHYVWNDEVDGPYSPHGVDYNEARFHGHSPLGRWEGDSVLVASYDLLKGLTKGNWAIMEGLFRNAGNQLAVHLPSDLSHEDPEYSMAIQTFTNVNAKSSFLLPRGTEETQRYEVQQLKHGEMMDPRDHFDVIFEQICAVHEMTKSVLFGTQAGVVSGSETDIKNYFNQVERYRQGRGKEKNIEFYTRVRQIENGLVGENYKIDLDIDFGPMFKISKEDKISAMLNHANALTILINGYTLTPDEARNILSEEWAEIDLDALTEEDRDLLDRINLTQVGAYEGAEIAETEGGNQKPGVGAQGRTQGQTPGSGMQQGQQTGSLANRDGIMSDEVVDEIANRVLIRIGEKLGVDLSDETNTKEQET